MGEGRVNRALKDIRLIGNLSNRSAYRYSDKHVKKTFRALHRELELARSHSDDSDGSGSGDFKL